MSGAAAVRVDGHCHIWRRARGDYRWLDEGGSGLDPIRRDFATADLRAELDAGGADRAIFVQAAPTVAETRFLLAEAAAEPRIAGVVGWVDLSSPDAAAEIGALGDDPLFKGVRPMLQDLPDTEWIARHPRADAVAALKRLGLRFDALVLSQHLPAFLRFATSHSDLPVIVDHAAKPAFAAPPDDPRHRLWREIMPKLAENPGTFCKLSGLLTELPAERRRTVPEAVEALRPHVDSLFAWFGPERLVWGSDWPVLTLAASYGFWCDVTDRLLEPLSESERASVMGGAAMRFYGIEAGAAPPHP